MATKVKILNPADQSRAYSVATGEGPIATDDILCTDTHNYPVGSRYTDTVNKKTYYRFSTDDKAPTDWGQLYSISLETSELEIPKAGGTFTVGIVTNATSVYSTSGAPFTVSVANNVVTVVAEANAGTTPITVTVNLYTSDNVAVNVDLVITQLG